MLDTQKLNQEFELMANKNWKTKIELLMRNDCPTKYFEQLSYDSDSLVRQYVAANNNCPSNILDSLVNDKYNICFKILENQNCTKEIIEKLCNHNDNDVKSRAIEKLTKFIEENKIQLARESNDFKILELLSKDSDELIRLRVANNPNTPSYILESFKNDPDEMVRFALIGNQNTPKDIVEELSNIEEYYVGNAERKVLEDEDRFEKMDESLFEKINLIKSTNDIDLIEKYSKSEEIIDSSFDFSFSIRLMVAQNPNTPSNILENLASDEFNYIRFEILDHPNITKEIIEKLSQDENLEVSSKALEKLDSLNINLKDTIEQASNYNLDKSNTSKNNHKNKP